MANAWEIPGGQFSLDAATPLDFRRFIKVNANGKAAYATAGTDPIVGISYTEALYADTPISIVGHGIAMVEASETIAAGDFVVPTTGGKAAAVESGTSNFIALTGSNADNLITVKLN